MNEIAIVFGDDDQIIDDPILLRQYHGFVYDDERFTDYLGGSVEEDALTQILSPGGYLCFEYDGQSRHLNAVIEYYASRALTHQELHALRDYTAGQWSDEIGENLATESGMKDGRSIQCQTDMPLRVQQLDE